MTLRPHDVTAASSNATTAAAAATIAYDRTLHVLINGLQMLTCPAPRLGPAEGATGRPSASHPPLKQVWCCVDDALPNLLVMEDYGRVELSFVIYASRDASSRAPAAALSSNSGGGASKPSNRAPPSWVLYLTIDGTQSIYLGRVSSAPSAVRTLVRYVPTHPVTFRLTVSTHEVTHLADLGIESPWPVVPTTAASRGGNVGSARGRAGIAMDPTDAATSARASTAVPPHGRHPEEWDLIDEIVHVLAEALVDDGLDSVAISHVLNKAESLMLFRRVVHDHYEGRFAQFLSSHPQAVTVVRSRGHEARIALSSTMRGVIVAAHPPVDNAGREAEAVRVLRDALQHRDLTIMELLDTTQHSSAVTQNWTASSTIFLRFLQSHRDKIWVANDPVHTTRMGLVQRTPRTSEPFVSTVGIAAPAAAASPSAPRPSA